MKDITIILPIHRVDNEYSSMLSNAIASVENFHNDVNVLIVAPQSLKKELAGFDFGQKLGVKIHYNPTRPTDFITHVNMGIDNCDTEWFSILEIDDEYHPSWLSLVNSYKSLYQDVDVYLPIVSDVNADGEFIYYTNESVWAYGFSKDQGYLDNELLLEFNNYQTSGGLYRTEVLKKMGKFKDNIKLTFSYELLLRLTHNGVKVMSIPRVGYRHVNFRENSLFWNYKNDDSMKLGEDEAKFWYETAKKEYFFKNKREITYEKQ